MDIHRDSRRESEKQAIKYRPAYIHL